MPEKGPSNESNTAHTSHKHPPLSLANTPTVSTGASTNQAQGAEGYHGPPDREWMNSVEKHRQGRYLSRSLQRPRSTRHCRSLLIQAQEESKRLFFCLWPWHSSAHAGEAQSRPSCTCKGLGLGDCRRSFGMILESFGSPNITLFTILNEATGDMGSLDMLGHGGGCLPLRLVETNILTILALLRRIAPGRSRGSSVTRCAAHL
ncbi:hypothetical protein K458DRAFT_394693 [Lentithecium fluviatile CBS 122367]|uniref:Uncharacterized protein n=1 Tax=Lentithecium fluviatile CBS 122367 TaxID=1168545 RepID=A0A6G1IK91_9PLEO|nr:hypothetical protein K458DRAFT_394693 [Lentithecium fluviatile CBS 122367]